MPRKGESEKYLQDLLRGLNSQNAARMVGALKHIEKVGQWAADMKLDAAVATGLRHREVVVQEHAILALSNMGERGAQHLNEIKDRLFSYDKQVQIAALKAIGKLGTFAFVNWRHIEELLDHQDLDIVAETCQALGSIQALDSAEKIAGKLHCGDVDIGETACAALARMDCQVDGIAKLLNSKEPRLRAAALNALKTMSQVEKYDSQVAVLIGDQDPAVRISAAEVICLLGAKAKMQASVIGRFLMDPDCGVVAAAATALGGIGAAAVSEISALESVLSDPREDNSTRPYVMSGLSSKAPAYYRKPACAAASALASMGVAAATVAPRLVGCLASPDSELRAEALLALGSLGKVGARFEPKVLERLNDPCPAVAAAACAALGSFGAAAPSSTVSEAVAELLDSKQAQVRAAACKSLAGMGDEAVAYLDLFLRMLNDAAVPVQVAALHAIAKCGEVGQMHAATVCRMMYKGHPAVRIAAIESLKCMGARGRSFYFEVQSFWKDPAIGHAACAALGAFEAANLAEEPLELDEDAVDLGYLREPEGSTQPVALLFPGQGSQYVKMMTEVQDLPLVQAMAEKAKAILGYDVLAVCLRGPEEVLEQTKVCQPAMFIAGLAALEELKRTKPEVVFNKRAVAGLSLGEYTALCAAGVFDFETGLKLVKLRGEAMQEAAHASPQMMVSIAGLERETLNRLCQESKTSSTDICTVANFLFPLGFSCAGSRPAVERLQQKALKEPGCLQAKVLKTSGAFHTEFMKPAKAKLLKALIEAEPKMRPPKCAVYMNVTGKKIPAGTPVPDIVDMLGTQLTRCVEWDTCMKGMIVDGIAEFYECGPMKQLKAMMKRISPTAWENTHSMMV